MTEGCCDSCERPVRKLYPYDGLYLCYECKRDALEQEEFPNDYDEEATQ